MEKLSDIIERLSALIAEGQRTSSNLPSIQIKLLQYLCKANRYSNNLTAASRFLCVSKSSLSVSSRSLIVRGYITVTSDTRDNRIQHLSLTARGRKLVETIEKIEILDVINTFSPTCSEDLNFRLKRLLANIQKRNGNRAFGTCHECRFFQTDMLKKSYRCGLTRESLTVLDSRKICGEFES